MTLDEVLLGVKNVTSVANIPLIHGSTIGAVRQVLPHGHSEWRYAPLAASRYLPRTWGIAASRPVLLQWLA